MKKGNSLHFNTWRHRWELVNWLGYFLTYKKV